MFKPPLPHYRLSSKDLNQPMMQIRTIGTSSGGRSSSGSRSRPRSCNRSFSMSKNDMHTKYGVPFVTAQSFQVIDGKDGRSLASFNAKKRVQVASLTKLMTCYTTIQLLKEFKVDLYQVVLVSYEVNRLTFKAVQISGTSAFLRPYDKLTIFDLLHGLLLPSGNDAANVLAENLSCYIKEPLINLGFQYKTQPFVNQMNQYAMQLDMNDTQFYNPHGLSNDQSYSCAEDMAILSKKLLEDPLIMQIVNKKTHTTTIQRNNKLVQLAWTNTNKMLEYDGYCGLKTGFTNKAGPCLATLFRKNNVCIIIIILNCLSKDIRWDDTLKLSNWAQRTLNNE